MTIPRTPEFYANLEKEAKTAAGDLAGLLTRAELSEYVSQLLLINALLRTQLQEQTSLMKPICIGDANEIKRRREEGKS